MDHSMEETQVDGWHDTNRSAEIYALLQGGNRDNRKGNLSIES